MGIAVVKTQKLFLKPLNSKVVAPKHASKLGAENQSAENVPVPNPITPKTYSD